MRSARQTYLIFIMGALMTGCGGTQVTVEQPIPPQPSVAVVQYVVDAVNPMRHTVIMPPGELNQSVTHQYGALLQTLARSGRFGQVIPGEQFVASEPYASAGRECRPALCPLLSAQMRRFVRNPEQDVDPQLVRTLAEATGAETVLFVLGEYWLQSGMRKRAVFRGYYALYAADGTRLVSVRASGDANAGVFPRGTGAVMAWQSAAQVSFDTFISAIAGL